MIDRPESDPLLDRFRARRDEAALRELMEQHAPMLRAVVRRVLRRRDLAEDAVQEAFVRLVRDPGAIRGAAGPWLRTVALNAALDLLRVEASQRRCDRMFDSPGSNGPGIDEEARALVAGCIADLDPEQRSLIARRFFLGQSQAEVAAEDGISQVAVHKRERRALEALRWRIVRGGLLDCLRAATGGELPAGHHGVVPDPAAALLVAILALPAMAAAVGEAGARAGVAAAALCDPAAVRRSG